MAVRYVPQFIETDLGFYKDILDRREAEYEQAFAMPLEIEDMYANIPTVIDDIETKNEVLNDFKSRVEDIVYKKYSGDYAAARRDLAREVMKEKQNPFFKIAPERYRLAEEERRLKSSLVSIIFLAEALWMFQYVTKMSIGLLRISFSISIGIERN